jgi:hypothetical protein
MTKIALCYAGLPISKTHAIESFLEKTKLKASDIDLYACFWNVNINYKCIEDLSKKFHNCKISYVEPENPQPRLPESFFKFPETDVFRMLSMLLIRKKLIDLIEFNDNKSYDAYLFVRPDITISKEVNIKNLIDRLDAQHRLYLPYAGNYRNGFTDTLILCDRVGIKIYLSAFDRLKEILEMKTRYVFPKNLIDFLRELKASLKMVARLLRGIITLKELIAAIYSVPFHPEMIIRRNIELSGLTPCFFDTGDIIIERQDCIVSTLTIQKKNPGLITSALSLKCVLTHEVNVKHADSFMRK